MAQEDREENSFVDKAQDFLTGMAWWKEEENVDDIEVEDLTGEAVVEEDQSFLGSAVDFLKNVDYKQLAEESIPIVGENIIIGDIKENLEEGSFASAILNTGALALGTVPIIGDLAAKPVRSIAKSLRKTDVDSEKLIDTVGEATQSIKVSDVAIPKKTVIGYKLFKVNKKNGNLYPLFVKMEGNKSLELNKWTRAEAGTINEKTGKVKSSLGDLAYRPGFHGGDLPIATHIGGKKGNVSKPNYRKDDQVWAEVEFADDTNWQKEALSRAIKNKDGTTRVSTAHITDQVPLGGHYRYKTNPNMTGNWIIGGELKINKILSNEQVKKINDAAGVADLPRLSELKFAEGGPVVELDEQTEMAFGNGSARVDPVSGNEVPPGALPSEVRDDIPARLSEGEYVVPADVLQYYGIKFFEDLRGKAKMELSGMEQNGRMGGEPVGEAPMESMEELPFGAEELQSYEDGQEAPAQGFNEGGPVTEAASMFPTTMIKTYINEAGSKLYIRFVNGIAIPPVPPGYVEEGSTIDAVVAPTTPTSPGQGRDESDEALQEGEPRVFLKDFGAMSAQELARFAGETADTTLNKILGGRLGSGQNKAWEAFVEKVQNNGSASQIEYINNLNTMKKAGDRDGLMALSGDLTHSDIMATGTEKTNSKKAGTDKDGTKFTFVVPGDSSISSISNKPLGKQLTNINVPTEAQKTTTTKAQEAAVKAEEARVKNTRFGVKPIEGENIVYKSRTDDAGSEGANVEGGLTRETVGDKADAGKDKDLGFREDADYGLMNKGGLASRRKIKKGKSK